MLHGSILLNFILFRYDEELDKSDLLSLDHPRGVKLPAGASFAGAARGGRDMRASQGKATWK